ncbi:phosphotransferase family protein [Nocardioides sp. J54]|uniref:phosphotransferase family protein n=1 Tax=Nocardioides sp. J54 TaxID=935866 RepID=UPI00048A6AB3|nr:aminoglycoside phosphotransferase family protein [Nocardioides sp. J54]
MSAPQPVADVRDLTPAWLTAALGAEVTAVHSVPVGTGQMGSCHRLALEGDPALPPTVLAKLPTDDPASREFLHGSYAIEVTFYRDLCPTVAVRVPRVHYAAISDDPAQRGTFTLLLEDLAPAQQGDQITGCTPAQARAAVENIAGLHAPRWCDRSLLDVPGLSAVGREDADLMDQLFPDAVETVLGKLGDLVGAEDAATLREVARYGGRWLLGAPDRFGLVHGDHRPDNLLVHPDGRLWTVDWQTLALGLPARDVALLVSSGLPVEERRRHERALVEAWHRRLVDLGVADYDPDDAWDDYRFALVQTPLLATFGCAYSSVRTERGDRMFAAMLARGGQALRDHATLDLLRALPTS